jgi:MFS family permease
MKEAGNGIGLLYLGIVFAPVSGWIIDRVGHRIEIQFMSTLAILALFLILKYDTAINPYYLLFSLGILFSVTESNSLALISYIVPDYILGTAYGLSACGISVTLLLEPALVGYLRESTGSFESSIWLFNTQILFGALFCGMIWLYRDNSHSNM